jgi:hypothetical protein
MFYIDMRIVREKDDIWQNIDIREENISHYRCMIGDYLITTEAFK